MSSKFLFILRKSLIFFNFIVNYLLDFGTDNRRSIENSYGLHIFVGYTLSANMTNFSGQYGFIPSTQICPSSSKHY